MVILGIDPGLAATGWGVIEKIKDQRSKIKVLGYGCVKTNAKSLKADRLDRIYQEIKVLIEKYKPEVVAVEELFFGANAKTAMMVGQACGVILLACGESGVEVREFTPLQIKVALTGYGRAEKLQVQKMVQHFLKLPELPKPDHAADALACAYCCILSQ